MLLTIYARPSSREQKIVWLDKDTAKISLKSPAKEGKANKELVDLLAKELSCQKSLIEIIRGHTIKIKHITVPDRFLARRADGSGKDASSQIRHLS